MTPLPTADRDTDRDLAFLDRWVSHGLMTDAQAVRIRAFESGEAPSLRPPTEPPLVVEGLGYLGGVLVAAAAALLGARWWDELALGGQLGVLGAVTLVLVLAGAAVPLRLGATATRLRSVLWLASTGTFAATCGVLADQGLGWSSDHVGVTVGGAAAVWALALWHRSHDVLPLLAVLVGTALAAGSAAAGVGDEVSTGLAVWGVAVLWIGLGWAGALGPRRVVLTSGALCALVGAMITSSSDAGLVLALLTAVAVLSLGVGQRDLALVGVGSTGAFVSVPRALSRWFPGSASAAAVLLLAGLLLVVAAVRVARRR